MNKDEFDAAVQAALARATAAEDAAWEAVSPLEGEYERLTREADTLEKRDRYYTSRSKKSPVSGADIASLRTQASELRQQLKPLQRRYDDLRWQVRRISELQREQWQRAASEANDAAKISAALAPCPRNDGMHVFRFAAVMGRPISGLRCQECEASVALHEQDAVMALLELAVARGLLARMPQLLPTPAETKEASES